MENSTEKKRLITKKDLNKTNAYGIYVWDGANFK